jgi:hypothetical protein
MSNMFDGVAGLLEGEDQRYNNMAAMLHELDPQDAIEGILCSNLLVAQSWLSRYGNMASNSENSFEVRDDYFAKMQKMMRQTTLQAEALQKYRNKGQQTVSVQHVTVNDGGQAVVGNIATNKEANNE